MRNSFLSGDGVKALLHFFDSRQNQEFIVFNIDLNAHLGQSHHGAGAKGEDPQKRDIVNFARDSEWGFKAL